MNRDEYIELGYRRAISDLRDALFFRKDIGQRIPQSVEKTIDELAKRATERAKE